MCDSTQRIHKSELLIEANYLIQTHEDFIQGIVATNVEQKNRILVFSGNFFLDDNGLPTTKTTAVFNMFKYLSYVLSNKYHLID